MKTYFFLTPLLMAFSLHPICAMAEHTPRTDGAPAVGKSWVDDRLAHFKGYPHLDMAYRKLKEGKTDEAAAEFRQYFDIIPSDHKARADFMNLLYQMGRYNEALALLDDQPGTQTSHALQMSRGMILMKLGDDANALAAFENALAAAQSNQEKIAALRSLVLVSKQIGLEEKTAEYLAQARSLAPEDESLLREQAILAGLEGNHSEAVSLGRLLVKLQPTPENTTILANSLFLSAQYQEAARLYAELSVQDPQMLYKAGLSLASAHLDKQAADTLEAFLRTNDNTTLKAETLLALGNIYTNQGDAAQGYRAFREASALMSGLASGLASALPRAAQTRLALGLGLSAMAFGKPAEAVEPLRQALELLDSPREKVKTLMSLAQAHTAAGETAKAAATWRLAAASPGALRDDMAVSEENLGYALTALGDYVGAERAFHRALAITGPNWRVTLAEAQAEFKAGLYEKALEDFAVAVNLHSTPGTRLSLGRTYEKLGKPGLALVSYKQAEKSVSGMPPREQREFYLSLGFLYAGEASYAEAAEAFRKAQALGYDAETAVRLGRVERLAGQGEAARQTLEMAPPWALSESTRLLRLSELAFIAEADQRYEDAATLLEESLVMKKDADLFFRQGNLLRKLHRNPDAIAAYRKSLAMGDNPERQAALGYALSESGQYAEAAQSFEAALNADNDYLFLREDLGYAYMHEARNDRAVASFKRAIDDAQMQRPDNEAEQIEMDKKIHRLRQEVTKLQTNVSATAYLSYIPDQAGSSKWTGGDTSHTIRSGGGAELAWIPPFFGLRDDRILQVIGRVSANLNENNSFSFDEDTWQGAVGLRYKPFKSQNFNLGAERLFHIGDKAEDNWLLRAMYSWADGYDLKPGTPYWNYSFFFGEYDYYASEDVRSAIYGEVRQGMTFNVNDKLLVTPHIVADTRITEPDRDQTSLVEFGAGVSLRFLFPAFEYEVSRSSMEILLQYKGGTLFHAEGHNKNNTINSLFLTTSITY